MQKLDPYNTRLVKLPLQISLLRQIDELIVAGVGGYADRNDFIRDAITGLLAETHYQMEASPPRRGPAASLALGDREAEIPCLAAAPTVGSLPALRWPASVSVTLMERSDYETDDVPLLGLHNRDFPSLWAAVQIAEITSNGTTDADTCLDEVVQRAWTLGKLLESLERPGSPRYSALFPTNRKKKESSEANFRAFAIGRVVGNGTKRTIGPLFQWRLCGVSGNPKDLRVGLLPAAEPLLARLDGISPDTPHSADHARAFLDHLRGNAAADFGMLMRVVGWIEEEPTRERLVENVACVDADWSPQQANGYAAGYVARAREWGLVEPKMIDNTYSLTDFGKGVLSESGRKGIAK